MHVNEKYKKEVKHILKIEKLRLVLYPLVVSTFLYGVWMFSFSSIMGTFKVYDFITPFVNNYQVGSIFMLLSIIMMLSFKFRKRSLFLFMCLISLAIWSMFTVSFLMSPPPNTIWILSALLSYLSFILIKRI